MEIIAKDKRIIAVIIAIESYRYSDISTVHYAENDAMAFKQLLIDYFGAEEENITLWVNEDATKTALEEELPYYIRQLSNEDKFIFYYAGHGFHYTDSNRLTVWDSHKNNLFGTTVSIDDVLLQPLLKSDCQSSLIFLDSCSTYISDSISGRDLISSMSVKEFEDFGNCSNYNAVFCSCSPGEKSFPSKILKHGIWTWHLIEALKGNMPLAIFKDIFVTNTSLQNFLRNAVPEFITKQTTIKAKQTPYSKVSSSNTFTIRQLPPPKEEEVVKEFPRLKLKFDEMEMRRIETENAKNFSGFEKNKGHFPPKLVNSSGNRFMQTISLKEIEDEIQEIYENSKSILGLKRRNITKEVDNGGGAIVNEIFRFYLDISQNEHNPALADITRRLIIRVGRSELPTNFHDIFPIQPNEIVIPIDGKIDFDDLVEKFENLEEEMGGDLSENDAEEIIVYTTTENLTITINIANREMTINPNLHLNCLGLIEVASKGLSKITGQKLLLLP